MRSFRSNGSLSVHAISGTYVVLLGMDLAEAEIKNLLGFAIHRRDHTAGREDWLQNMKRFPGRRRVGSSEVNPFQEFVWGDYTAKPGRKYTYTIIPMYAPAGKLRHADEVSIDVETVNCDLGTHAVYFNRGTTASQAYERKFHNKRPDQLAGPGVWEWLSRGLEQAMIDFIKGAKDSAYSIRASVYEFRYPRIVEEFRNAVERGVDVRIIFDAKKNGEEFPREDNIACVRDHDLGKHCTRRESNPSYISHNKFMVLLHNGAPMQVWTGSTNISLGGIFGQSNVGHVVRDPGVARRYLEYWNKLKQDPTAAKLSDDVENISPFPDLQRSPQLSTVFSPRNSLEALDAYAEAMDKAKQCVFFTGAFGVNKRLREVLNKDKDYLRYLLLEKLGMRDEDKREMVVLVKRDLDNRIAVGSYLNNRLGEWTRERLTELNTHVRYVHTKFMLLDAFTDSPTLITGSANFSDASTKQNDENMLIIRGYSDVIDVYLTEFMRIFNHFEFRQYYSPVSADLEIEKTEKLRTAGPFGSLALDDSWAKRFYKKDKQNHARMKERVLFAGKPKAAAAGGGR
jgi:phosphatidylserine/phosphatidylglycerophosphate/cardiolipin synthase-like enzyme